MTVPHATPTPAHDPRPRRSPATRARRLPSSRPRSRRTARSRAGYAHALAALQDARLLVPVVAVLGEVELRRRRAGPRQDQRHGHGAADRSRRPDRPAGVHRHRRAPRLGPGGAAGPGGGQARRAVGAPGRRRSARRRRRRPDHASRSRATTSPGWPPAGGSAGSVSALPGFGRRRNDPVDRCVDRSVPMPAWGPIRQAEVSSFTPPTRIDRRPLTQVVGSGPAGYGRGRVFRRHATAVRGGTTPVTGDVARLASA